jgi:amidase
VCLGIRVMSRMKRIDEVDLHTGPRRIIGHGGEGVRMMRGHNPESARLAEPIGNAPCPSRGLPRRHTVKKPTRRDAGLAAAAIGAEAQTTLALDNTPMSDVIQALASGRVTATALTNGYLARIAAYDRDGPNLNSVRELNADALAIASKFDEAKPSVERPLAGVPILLKDNIATGDKQPTTAGSLALQGARARGDAIVVRLLRDAGAVILGKANLTEFANILAIDMPSGYSSLGGQVKNPYAPTLMDDRGIPVVLPGGSSSGSAVAVAAGLCAASIGTETSGSLLNPASQNGLVTVKPTVGLISRAGILPISHSQDTAGPMTRTVRDAAILLNVLAAKDPLDPATQRQRRPADYTADLAHDAMKGARIGVPSDPVDPLNDGYYGKLPPKTAKVMADAIKVLQDLGAVIVRANMPTAGWIGGPGTTMAVLNRNPLSRNKGNPATPPIVFLYELKRDLNLYLKDWATNTRIKTIADIVAFNEANAGKALRFGQDLFLAANLTKGDLSELEYKSARAMDLLSAKTRGMDAYMNQHKLDAVLFAGSAGAAIAAKAGYPSVMVPGGFISGSPTAKDTPDYPLGVTFAGRAWSERKLLRLAYAYEQASNMRKAPPDVGM